MNFLLDDNRHQCIQDIRENKLGFCDVDCPLPSHVDSSLHWHRQFNRRNRSRVARKREVTSNMATRHIMSLSYSCLFTPPRERTLLSCRFLPLSKPGISRFLSFFQIFLMGKSVLVNPRGVKPTESM